MFYSIDYWLEAKLKQKVWIKHWSYRNYLNTWIWVDLPLSISLIQDQFPRSPTSGIARACYGLVAKKSSVDVVNKFQRSVAKCVTMLNLSTVIGWNWPCNLVQFVPLNWLNCVVSSKRFNFNFLWSDFDRILDTDSEESLLATSNQSASFQRRIVTLKFGSRCLVALSYSSIVHEVASE